MSRRYAKSWEQQMPKRPRVVADAGPLMALAKLNVLPLLKRLYGRVLVSQTVYDEVVTEGLARGYPDAGVVQRLLKHSKKESLISKSWSFSSPRSNSETISGLVQICVGEFWQGSEKNAKEGGVKRSLRGGRHELFQLSA